MPQSAQAHPHTSCSVLRVRACPGAGDTMTDSGATDQTGTVLPTSPPAVLGTGSVYQRVVKGPDARVAATVMRVSHLTLLVP
jgi:hypothetical protein